MAHILGEIVAIKPLLFRHESVNCTIEMDTQAIEAVIEKMFYGGSTEQECRDFIIANASKYFTAYLEGRNT